MICRNVILGVTVCPSMLHLSGNDCIVFTVWSLALSASGFVTAVFAAAYAHSTVGHLNVMLRSVGSRRPENIFCFAALCLSSFSFVAAERLRLAGSVLLLARSIVPLRTLSMAASPYIWAACIGS